MAIKKYGPTTPGRRGMTVTDYSVLTKVAPERSLLEPMKKHSGRNNTGRITVRHQGDRQKAPISGPVKGQEVQCVGRTAEHTLPQPVFGLGLVGRPVGFLLAKWDIFLMFSVKCSIRSI